VIDMRRRYQAVARNAQGLTFMVYFWSTGWHRIQEAADAALAAAVAADPGHQALGPWEATNIDVSS
jgi:hypothetical protein